jgi:c-di-GMP-binding flagellar brake protein YcgR
MSSHPGKATTSAPDRRRRRYPRYRCDFSVIVTLLTAGNYQKLNAHCKDLSEAGMGTIVAAELSSGDVVSLTFSLPGSHDLWEVRAVLRHRRGYHYGFEFLSLAPERSEVLKAFIQSRDRAD